MAFVKVYFNLPFAKVLKLTSLTFTIIGLKLLAAQSSFPIVDPDHSTPLPNSSNPHANIYIETLSLPKSQPAALYGSILVRNLAFEKQAALRCHLARQCSI